MKIWRKEIRIKTIGLAKLEAQMFIYFLVNQYNFFLLKNEIPMVELLFEPHVKNDPLIHLYILDIIKWNGSNRYQVWGE